ncbi:hypothetical protein COCC4DRAFT_76458 [Bipolaris maydis ATCC 48331]|uniref:Uncharacterized protein n=2 Tax=Cochliobolus heterostrophus TaxID=5016 RepID=M2TFF8_COCH5|nr:uncharacterized protein COCC4DRAFT_76458 [Bipolaris maydis ATCC 48331]EMD85239.1 hypothetical protein COCHEDRAFT_1024587 [Bipolaris maydis C5]ENH99482.1 hypothetical protein COCC4DRAFT_76458 [Bipolaris maydis ATCC 48331]
MDRSTANSDAPELTSAGGGSDWNNSDGGKDNEAGVGIKLDDHGTLRTPSSECALIIQFACHGSASPLATSDKRPVCQC